MTGANGGAGFESDGANSDTATSNSADSAGANPADSASDPDQVGVTERIMAVANVVAPVTVITSLLLYFGYVGTRARLDYFGVYLDMVNMSNMDLVLSGLEVIYFPAAMIFFALFVGAALHGAITWLLTAPNRDTANLVIGAVVSTLGLLAIGRALVGMFRVSVARAEVPGTTPLALALGPVLLAYGAWIGWQVLRRQAARAETGSRLLDWFGAPRSKRVRRIALTGVGGLLVAGLFWAANSFASAFGAGRAYDDAVNLADRPEVVIDTKDRLVEPPPGVRETLIGETTAADDAEESRGFQYRYHGLRLLIEADGRLYLVPAEWTEQSRTVVLPYEDVRIQLIP